MGNIAILAVSLLLSDALGAEPPPPFDLKAAIQYANDHSPTLQTALKEVGIRNRSKKNSVWKFFPSLDLGARQGVAGTTLGATSTPLFGTLEARLSETIYDNGTNIWELKQARLSEKQAEIELEKTRNAIASQIAKAYYRFSLSDRLAEISSQQEKIFDQQLKTIESQYEQGIRTRRDYLRFKTRAQRAEISRISAENDRKSAIVTLHRLLGLPAEEIGQEGIRFKPLREEKKSPDFPTQAPKLASHYDSRLKEVGQNLNDIPVRLALRNYLPRADLSAGIVAGAGVSTPTTVSDLYIENPALSWNVTLSLTYNLWDWGRLRRDWAKAEMQRDQANNSLIAAQQQAASEIQNVMLTLKRLSLNFNLSRELLASEEEAYRFIESEYRQGKASYLDLTTSLDSLIGARSSYASTYFSTLEGLVDYHYHQGDLYESLLQK